MGVTLNAQIEKPDSEQDSQKVTVYNTAVDELDASVHGMLTKSVAGSGDLTPELTRAEALHAVFKFTGVLTGNKTVKFPVTGGSSRLVLIWNATTGNFTLTIKTTDGSSTGVDVGQDFKALLFHDDVHFYYAAPEAV